MEESGAMMDDGDPAARDRLADLLASGRLPTELAKLVTDLSSGAGAPERRAFWQDVLTVFLRHPGWQPRFEEALASEQRFASVSDMAASLIAQGVDQYEVYRWLSAFYLFLQSQGRQEDEDVVVEALDELFRLLRRFSHPGPL